MDDIKTKYKDKKNVLLITHGGVSVAIVLYFDGDMSYGTLVSKGLKTCEVRIFDL